MKKSMVLFIYFIFAFCSFVVAGDMTFEIFKKLVTENVVLGGFTLNKSRTFDMKAAFHVEFKGDESKMEMISITIFPIKDEFSELDKIRKPESYKYKDRPALYTDGNNQGCPQHYRMVRLRQWELYQSYYSKIELYRLS